MSFPFAMAASSLEASSEGWSLQKVIQRYPLLFLSPTSEPVPGLVAAGWKGNESGTARNVHIRMSFIFKMNFFFLK